MNQKEWLERAYKLLKAIEFNYDHPSPMRTTVGGLEIDMIRQMIQEYGDLKWIK